MERSPSTQKIAQQILCKANATMMCSTTECVLQWECLLKSTPKIQKAACNAVAHAIAKAESVWMVSTTLDVTPANTSYRIPELDIKHITTPSEATIRKKGTDNKHGHQQRGAM